MPEIRIDRHEGMSTMIAPEKLPAILYREIRNYEFSSKNGWLKKRKGYGPVNIGDPYVFSDISNMIEVIDKGGNRFLFVFDGGTFRYLPFSAWYGHSLPIANNERTSGSTADTFFPVKYQGEIRSGSGINASTDRPIWYGYKKSQDRFISDVTISAGSYLEDQDYRGKLTDLIESTQLSIAASYVSASGIEKGYHYSVAVAPLIDGYQRGFPEEIDATHLDFLPYANNVLRIDFNINTADAQKHKRLTGFNVFVAKTRSKNDVKEAGYRFLTTVSLQDGSDIILVRGCTLDSTLQTATFTDYVEWLTFEYDLAITSVGIRYNDKTNNKTYYLGNLTLSGADAIFDIFAAYGDTAPSSGAVEGEFYIDWKKIITYTRTCLYDDYYYQLGEEMYDYIGVPRGDIGIDDFRYKFSAIAGRRLAAIGFPGEEGTFFYYSKAYDMDIFPSTNVQKMRKDPTAIAPLGDESFIVFYNNSADIITIYGNQNHRIQSSFNTGCTNQKALISTSDGNLYWMSYATPQRMNRANALESIGEQLIEWWEDKLTNSHKESCVVSYNQLFGYIIYSFPTYTDSDFPNGVSFVYDLNAVNSGKASPWWILETDVLIKGSCQSEDLRLYTVDGVNIKDWNSASPVEHFSSFVKMLLFKNTSIHDRINLSSLSIDFSDDQLPTANSLTAKVYIDESSTPSKTITISESDKKKIVEYPGDVFEVELISTSGTSNTILKTIIIEYEDLYG